MWAKLLVSCLFDVVSTAISLAELNSNFCDTLCSLEVSGSLYLCWVTWKSLPVCPVSSSVTVAACGQTLPVAGLSSLLWHNLVPCCMGGAAAAWHSVTGLNPMVALLKDLQELPGKFQLKNGCFVAVASSGRRGEQGGGWEEFQSIMPLRWVYCIHNVAYILVIVK